MRTESFQHFASRSASLRWLQYHRYSVFVFEERNGSNHRYGYSYGLGSLPGTWAICLRVKQARQVKAYNFAEVSYSVGWRNFSGANADSLVGELSFVLQSISWSSLWGATALPHNQHRAGQLVETWVWDFPSESTLAVGVPTSAASWSVRTQVFLTLWPLPDSMLCNPLITPLNLWR
jgi:hypothetical protein